MTARRIRLRPRATRSGMSLIEIMIAMVMLGIVLVTIAKLSLSVAYAGRTNDLVSTRTAVLQQQAARLGAVPYATLQAMSTSADTITVGGTAYARAITLTTAPTYTTVKIVLTPTSNIIARDSLSFTRANASGGSPLCTGC